MVTAAGFDHTEVEVFYEAGSPKVLGAATMGRATA